MAGHFFTIELVTAVRMGSVAAVRLVCVVSIVSICASTSLSVRTVVAGRTNKKNHNTSIG